MRLRMLLGVLVLSLAVASCGLIKEKGGDEEKAEEKAEKKDEEKAGDKKPAAEASAPSDSAAAAAAVELETAKQAAALVAEKAVAERAAMEAEKQKLIEEKKAAEEAVAKAEAEKFEAEKKGVIDAVAGLGKSYTETRAALRANRGAWEAEGNAEKLQAIAMFIPEYEKVEGELGGIKAYLMQDDLEKAKTGMETLKGTYEALEKQAAVLLEDKPQDMDGTTRAKILDLIASESCLQKAIAAGALTDADLGVKRSELLAAAGMTAEQYDKLRAKLAKKPEPTDAIVLQAIMDKKCPAVEAPPVEETAETGEAYWKKSCEHTVSLMKTMGGDLSQAEMDKLMVEIGVKCLEKLKKEDPAIADKIAACVLAVTSVDDLEACDPKKITGGDAQPGEEVKPEEVKPEEVKPEEVKPEEVKPEEVKPEEKPKVPAISKNMKFTGSLKGKGKSHTLTLHKKGSKAKGTIWFSGGKVPLSGSFSKKGATFSGKKGKNKLSCSGKFKGSKLVGKCSGILDKSFSGKFTLKGKRQK